MAKGASKTGKRVRWTTESFVERCKEVHGDVYDYSKVVYAKTNQKVVIICKQHGQFDQIAASHLQGRGCIACGFEETGNKLRGAKDAFIEKANKKYGNKYDYSLVDYKTARIKVQIVCKDHGSFYQVPYSHTSPKTHSACPQCPPLDLQERYAKRTEVFIEKSKEIHGENFDYSKAKYSTNEGKVTLVCKDHGEFVTTPITHYTQYGGCPHCKLEGVQKKMRIPKEEFLERALMLHEGKYSYENVEYVDTRTKVLIRCDHPEHKDFMQSPSKHLMGRGCPQCAIEIRARNRCNDTEYFLKAATEVHGNLYDYRDVVYTAGRNKVDIHCQHHGLFSQDAQAHLSGKGCQQCAANRARASLAHTKDEFVTKAREVHGGLYCYDKTVYVNSKTSIEITCHLHGDYHQLPYNHLMGKRCIQCAQELLGDGWLHPMYKTEKPSNLYIILIEHDNGEDYIKVGLAVNLQARHYQIRKECEGDVTLIKAFADKANLLAECERYIFSTFREHKYDTGRDFGGYTECLDIECLTDVLIHIDHFLQQEEAA